MKNKDYNSKKHKNKKEKLIIPEIINYYFDIETYIINNNNLDIKE